MKPFFAALRFLTVLPVPAGWAGGERELGRSLAFFPVVGILIGGLMALLDCFLVTLLQAPFFSSAVIVVAMAGTAGWLHVDGLADTADGFLSGRGRERILEIMEDSRTGAMGVAAVVSLVILKVAALTALPAGVRWQTIVLMVLAGRCALVIKMAALPYARPQGGLVSLFHQDCTWVHSVWASLFLVATGWGVLKWAGVVAALASFGATWLFAAFCRRKIGGLTGDTLGAACELVELAPAVAVMACMGGCLQT